MSVSSRSSARHVAGFLNNIPMFWKLAAAPGFTFIFMLAVISVDHASLRRIVNGAQSILSVQFRPTMDAMNVTSDVNRAVAELYLALALAETGEDTAEMVHMVVRVGATLEEAHEKISRISAQVEDETSSERFEAVAYELAAFDQPIAFMAEMLEVDADAARAFLPPLQERLERVQIELNRAVKYQDESAVSTIELIARAAGTTEYLGAVLVVSVLGIFSFVVPLILKNILRSIDTICNTTQELAGGNLAVDIDHLERRDELGKIVGALRVFRDSLFERAQLEGMRVQAEAKLRQSNDTLSAVVGALDSVRDQIFIEDEENYLVYLNTEAVKKNCLGAQEIVVGERFNQALPGFASILHRYESEVRAVLEESGVWQRELSMTLAADVEPCVYDVRAANLVDGGVIYSVRDISESVRAAQTERALRQQLSESRKLEEVGHLAGGIAHDFNNMIAAIQGFAVLVSQHEGIEAAPRQYAERIQSVCQRGANLVREILLFARAEKAEKLAYDLTTGLAAQIDDLRTMAGGSVSLATRIPKTPAIIEANETQIGQVLSNLVQNAAHACEQEEGRVMITLCEQEILQSQSEKFSQAQNGRIIFEHKASLHNVVRIGVLNTSEKYVRLCIRDTGAGMSPLTLQRALETFFTTKDKKGTGLGLSVVQRIIVAHRGALEIRTQAGVGTRVSIFLPSSTNQVTLAPSEKAPSIPSGRTLRVMIVDDDKDVGDTLTLNLARLGFEVTCLVHAHQAYEMFAADPARWDLVLTDQVMGGDRGINLIKRMQEIKPSGRYVLMTGYDGDISEHDALSAGASAYIEKPVNPEVLAAQLSRLAAR